MKAVLVSLLLFNVAWTSIGYECGKKIIGRKDIRNGIAYPWMVGFQRNSNDFTFCSGAIITRWHAIAAAHCFQGLNASEIVLIVGSDDINDALGDTYETNHVDKIVVHPKFDKEDNMNDLAIVVTSEKIKFNEFVGPVCMPTKLTTWRKKPVKVLGWENKKSGWSDYDNLKDENKLREVDYKKVSMGQCKNYNESVICTFTNFYYGKGTNFYCLGENSGPVVWQDPETKRYTLVGVVAWADNECVNHDLNTNVSAYLKWINEIIKKNLH